MNTPQSTDRDSVESTALFADLVAKYGEQNGGSEDFFVHNENRIGCRYADLSMHRKEDGWHYGQLPEAYPTPAECYARHREDEARFHSAPAAVRSTDWFDDDEDDSLCYDPETDCPRCHGAGKCALLSGIEWDYCGPDYDTCPRCGGTGRL